MADIPVKHIFIPGFVKEGEGLTGLAFIKKIIPVDGYLREMHRYSRVTTDYPVEKAAYTNDFSKRRPPQPELDIILADCVAGTWNPVTGIVESYEGRKDQLMDDILALYESDVIFSANTSRGIYDNCLFEEISNPIEIDDEDTIRFTAKLKQIRFASSKKQESSSNAAAELTPIVSGFNNIGRTIPRKLQLF